MPTNDVITILTDAKDHLDGFGLCQGAYALDSNNDPVAGKAGALGAGLNGIDMLGAIHRAAYEGDLLAFEEEAKSAIATYLGYAQREDTSGTILRDWNDVSGRDTAAVTGLIDTVLASL